MLALYLILIIRFFFQAEDGIRDFHVTGVQTCALPIFGAALERALGVAAPGEVLDGPPDHGTDVGQVRGARDGILEPTRMLPQRPRRQPGGVDLEGNRRSEERRVGKECGSRWSASRCKR